MRRPLLFAALLVLAPATASAGEGFELKINEAHDNVVVGRALLNAPETDIRQAFEDVIHDPDLYPRVLHFEAHPDGECETIVRKTKGLFSPMTMHTRRCPTPNGWVEKLVSSEDFSAYQSTLTVEKSDQGHVVVFGVKTELHASIPQGLVNSAGAKSVKRTLDAVLKRLAGEAGTP